ncbi:MAG: hypothetical protein ALAOOOJD_00982 [bacterium]|nr:hypothetical protein [bacterium]
MRITSVTTHTVREQVGLPFEKSISALLRWLARGFVLGAYLSILLITATASAQNRLGKDNGSASPAATQTFEDSFDGGSTTLNTTNWGAHPAYKIKVKTVGTKKEGQLYNNATGLANDHWDGFLAAPKTITNPNIVKIVYGDNSDETGRAFTGVVMLMSKPDTTATGYLIFHYADGNGERVRLWKISKGKIPEENGEIDSQPTSLSVQPLDTLAVEFTTDEFGHHFTVTVNGKEDATVTDPDKFRDINANPTYYGGIMINGNTNNGIDYFYAARTKDTAPPNAVTTLAVSGATASSITLKWKAPGDDDNQGTAATYDLRYSLAPINDGNFAGATKATTVPKPAVAGTLQSATVSGLNGGTTYYFALKATDKAGNTSELSNVVSSGTVTVNTVTDDFNRAGPGLGTRWKADANMKIVKNAMQNTATSGSFRIAVFDAVKNPTEVAMKWGPNTTPTGHQFSGILVMANGAGNGLTSNGYFIQYAEADSTTRLWHVVNGEIESSGALDEGQAFVKRPPAASTIRVEISSDATGHKFQVYINNQQDRLLVDKNKLEALTGPLYAGVMLDSQLGEENAIDEFSASVPVGQPKKLEVFDGNNQFGSVEEQLPNPLAVLVSDSLGNPVPNVPISFEVGASSDAVVNSPPILDGNIRIEAEHGKFSGPLEARSDPNAAGGKYAVYPAGFFDDANDTLYVDIAEAGTYYMWIRSLKNGDKANWDVVVDGAPPILYDVFHGGIVDGWNWELLSDRGTGSASEPEINPVTFNWNAGKHTIIFKVRYEELGLDKIILTTNPNFIPTGKEELGFTSDKDGVARAVITLGIKAGNFTAQAKYGSLAPATFNFIATGGKAAKIEKISGDGQTGPAGQQLGQAFVVAIRDANNNLVGNYPVDWVVTDGNGKLSLYRSITDLNGKAQTFLTLGNQSPTNKVEARVPLNVTLPSFTATTISGVAASASVAGGNNQSATVRTALTNPLLVKVADGNGNGVANYPIEFTVTRGGGSTTALNRVNNAGFENINNGTTLPAGWTLEGTPTTAEVQASTETPKAGSRSLKVSATRSGVGVSQSINYLANTTYTLSFYAKVTSGTARVTWQMAPDQVIDMTPASTKSSWQFFTIYANSPTAGARLLSFKTNGSTATFFIDDLKILPNTGGNGQASIVWTMGDTAGTQQGQARVLNGAGANLTGSPLNFSATAKAGAAARVLKKSGDNQAGAANQALPLPFVAKVTDATAINGVANVSVKFEVIAGGGKFPGATPAAVTVVTNASGEAAATLTLGPTSGVMNKVKVTATGVAKPDTFVALAAVPNKITKVSGPTAGSAGRKLATPLVVKVVDSASKPIPGFPVLFTVKTGNGTINNKTSDNILTDTNGQAKAYPVLGTIAGGQNRFEATVAQLSGQVITYTVTAARLKTLSYVSGNNQPAGVVSTALPQPLKVKVLDSLQAGIKEQNVIFTVTAGNGKVNGVSTPVTVKTDTAGVASIVWTLGPTPGTNNNKVQASTNPALTGSPILFQASAIAGAPKNLVKFTPDSISSVVGSTLPLTAKVTDIGGNPKADVDVTFTIKSGGGKVNNAATVTVKSLANGQATVTLLLGTTAGAYINVIEVKALVNNVHLAGSPLTYRISGTSSKAQKLLLSSGNKQEGPAGELLPKPLRVKVEDKDRNGVANHPVTFKVTRGEGNLGANKAELTVNTDGTGFAQTNWYLGPSTKPDSQVVEASSNDGVNKLQGVPVKFIAYGTPGLPNAETSFVQAVPGTLPADGSTRCQVTVFVRDRFGNPIANVPVTIDVTGDGVKVNQPATPTNKDGEAQGSFTATRAETKTVTARVISAPPTTISRGATVKVTPLDAKSLVQGGGNGQIGNINTALTTPLGAKVADANGNGVPNYEVKFKVERGDGKLVDPLTSQFWDSVKVRTDNDGFAKVQYICGPAVGENQIRVSAGSLFNSPLLYLASVRNSSPAKIEMIEGSNNQQGIVGEFLRNPAGVRVVDSNNRPIFGAAVKFSISLGGGLLNEQKIATVISDAFGEAKVSWRLGPEAGLNVLRAETPGLANSPIDFEAQANPDRATALRSAGSNPVYGQVNGLSEPLTVQTVDPLGNGVQGVGVIFELIDGAGSLTEGYTVTGDGGYAAVRVRLGPKSGWTKVRASSEGLGNSPLIFMVYAEAQNAVKIVSVTRTNNQTGTKGKLLNFPLQVLVQDNGNNPVSGVQVQFVVTAGGGSFNGNGFFSATSDTNGIAAAPWTLGEQAGPNTAKANKAGLIGSPVTFNATAVDNNLPIIDDVPDVVAVENEIIRFTIGANDEDGDAITYQGRNLPTGSSFDVLKREFVWDTDLNSAGTFEPSFIARDSKGGTDEEIVTIHVANRNRPPVMNRATPALRPFAIADTVIRNPGAGGSFTMRVYAADPDGDVLSYRWYRDGVFTNAFTNEYLYTYSAVNQTTFAGVSVIIFDKQDTTFVTWRIKVPVELSSFSATIVESQRVLLNWKTASEQNNVGFNVLRSRTEAGKYEKINDKLIPPRHDGEYEFADASVDAGGKYFYKLESIDRDGQVQLHGPIQITIALPQSFALEQNYPNPFNPSTNLRFELPKAAIVTLSIYNSLGQEVRRLINGQTPAGYHTIVWNGKDQQGRVLPSGLYHYRLQAGDYVATKKMILAK